MGVKTEKYIRKPLFVDAVRVSTHNFDEIAAWCQGEVQVDEETRKQFIKVRVHLPKIPRQTKAYPGDWILYTDKGYKVYTNKAFRTAFDKVTDDTSPSSEVKRPTDRDPEDDIRDGGRDPIDDPTPEDRTPEDGPVISSEEFSEQQEDKDTDGLEEDDVPIAPSDKRVLSEEEQRQMGQDEVRELLRTGEVVLAQDLATDEAA